MKDSIIDLPVGYAYNSLNKWTQNHLTVEMICQLTPYQIVTKALTFLKINQSLDKQSGTNGKVTQLSLTNNQFLSFFFYGILLYK